MELVTARRLLSPSPQSFEEMLLSVRALGDSGAAHTMVRNTKGALFQHSRWQLVFPFEIRSPRVVVRSLAARVSGFEGQDVQQKGEVPPRIG